MSALGRKRTLDYLHTNHPWWSSIHIVYFFCYFFSGARMGEIPSFLAFFAARFSLIDMVGLFLDSLRMLRSFVMRTLRIRGGCYVCLHTSLILYSKPMHLYSLLHVCHLILRRNVNSIMWNQMNVRFGSKADVQRVIHEIEV